MEWSVTSICVGSTLLILTARHALHQVDITTLLASDLGAAAGYEALRLFDYHKSIYRQPLMDDHEREEEALAGLATAEGQFVLMLV